MDKLTPQLIWYIFLFLMPGFLMAFWVNLFVPLRPGTDNKNLLTYIFLSLLLSLPLLLWYGYWGKLPFFSSFHQLVGLLAYGIAVPFLGGALASKIVHNPARFPWTWLEKTGVRPVHPIASAWDKVFLRTFDAVPFVLVTLKDGKQIGGLWDAEAIASSDPTERDIFLGKAYRVSADGDWTAIPKGLGTLITADQIATIDFVEPESS